MKFALIIVDMLKDTFEKHPELYISKEAMKFVPTINHLSSLFRGKRLSCDLCMRFFFAG